MYVRVLANRKLSHESKFQLQSTRAPPLQNIAKLNNGQAFWSTLGSLG